MDTSSLIIALPLVTFGITLAYILLGDQVVGTGRSSSASSAGAQPHARRASESRTSGQRSVAGRASGGVAKAA